MAFRCLALFALLLMAASDVRAEDAAPADSSQDRADEAHKVAAPVTTRRDASRMSVRLAGAFGLGRPALAGRAGLAGEYWLSDMLGIGLSASILRQSAFLGDESASQSVALVGTLRGAAYGGYAYFSVGAGYAHVEHTFQEALCLATECADRVERYHGIVIGAALGWLFHPVSLLELGPMLRLDLLLDPRGNTPADLAVTLGFELGLAS